MISLLRQKNVQQVCTALRRQTQQVIRDESKVASFSWDPLDTTLGVEAVTACARVADIFEKSRFHYPVD